MAARKKKEKAKRLNGATVDHVARILDRGEPTKFRFEGTIRHGLRAQLCLAGVPWPVADANAAEIVGEALRRIGAHRPSWKQGQPEWTQEGFAPVLRLHCIRCGSRLQGEQTKFCGSLCKVANHMAIARMMEIEDGRTAYDIAASDRRGRVATIYRRL